ncbi:MAG: hypothetical protein M3Y27_06165 [Acidobacteriota bacterium]|nr:hypothetical protein [Acidobacteriota bacterium]
MQALTLLLFAGSLFGQRILYNPTLEKQGQDAAAAAKKIASEPITAKEVQNLITLEKQQIDVALQAGFLNMRTDVQAFGTWDNVSRSVCKTLRMLYREDLQGILINAEVVNHNTFDLTCTVDALTREQAAYFARSTNLRQFYKTGTMDRLRELSGQVHQNAEKLKQTASAKTETAAKKATPKSAPPPDTTAEATRSSINSAIDRVGDVQDLLKFASSLDSNIKTDGQVKALQQIEDGLKQLGALIDTVNDIWDSYRGISVDPRSLVPSKEKLAASLLAVDAERLKELVAIRARNEMYLADLQKHLEDAVFFLDSLKLWFAAGEVENSLNSLTSRTDRINAITSLHIATAGAVANQTPFGVQALRESLAERRYALRRDAIYNGAYETALQAAGQRLAAYYGAGVKPTQVAALLYYLSGIVTLPKLAF